MKERELKLKEKELGEKKEIVKENTPNTVSKSIPNSPMNTKMQWVSKNFYGNGHDEYLFMVITPNTDAFPEYIYYSTNQNKYIRLNNIGRPANSRNSDYPNASDIQGVEFPDGTSYVIYRFNNGSLISVGNDNSRQNFQQY
ncbi:MAG: hypothetical protein EAZ20_05405 [Bacteroidetes bacterium]|nr:MAG: hypothetical protein EAZ20_05405 [Bacteroidota bacterium]